MFDLYTLGHYNKLEQLTTLFNVLMPIICVVLAVATLILLAKFVKSEKAQKITKLVMAGVLLLFSLIKPLFWIIRSVKLESSYIIKGFGFGVNFYLTILLIIVLVYSAFSKKQCKLIDWFKYTVLGIALPLGIISLINSKMLVDINDSWYHIVNLSSIIVNLAYIVYPIYLVMLKDVSFKLNNFWQAISGYVCICCLCMTLSLISGKSISSMTSLDTHLLIVNLKVGFPWHLIIIFPAFMLIAFGIYWLGHFITKLINKETTTQTTVPTPKNEFFDLYTFATKSIASMQGFLILIIVALITRTPQGSAFGILGLIPFVMEIFCMLSIYEMEKQLYVVDDSLFEEGNPITKRILTYVFIGNFIFGFAVLHQLKNERLMIEERKQREEKKKQKELQSTTTEEQPVEKVEETTEEKVEETTEETVEETAEKQLTEEETVNEEVEENNETTENE